MSSRPHICMLLDHAFPPDLRVENEARTLAAAGFEVTIMAIDPDHRPSSDLEQYVYVHRVRVPQQIRNKARGLAASLPLMDWIIGRAVRKLHRIRPIDALHAHDLYLFGAALQAGRRLKVPVVGDMHENWVEALRHYKWSTTAPGKWVVNFGRWQRLETEWSGAVDRLVVVIDEMAERMGAQLRHAGLRYEHIVTVPNTIARSTFETWSSSIPQDMPEGHPLLLYTGGMDRHRGLEDPIRAMPIILRSHPQAVLVLVGDGAVREELENLAVSLGLGEAVRFLGWKDQDTVRGYMEAADIGLIPHRKTTHTDHTIPHKLFHYMHAGLPCVVSDCRPLERIVSAEACGKVYSSGTPEALAASVCAILEDPSARADMAERGRGGVRERWNWEATSKGLIDLYRDLLG
jgi:glycosyltransferase involved in cell wall biosynthesis